MSYKRAGSRFIQIRVGGVRRSSGTTEPEAAKKLEDKLNLELWQAQHFGAKLPKSWQELCVKWAKEKSHKISWKEDLRAIQWWAEHLESVTDIRTITRDVVDNIILAHRPVNPSMATPENNTANHYVSILRSMLIAACREWDWIERAPKLRTYEITDGNEAWYTPEQWVKVYAEIPLHLKRAAKFSLGSGLRKGKVFPLEWTQINMKNRSYSFKGTANKLGNTIPLNDTCMEVLDEILSSNVRHFKRVFCWEAIGAGGKVSIEPLNDYGKAWWKGLERAGLGHYDEAGLWHGEHSWHSLRHTFASWLGNAAVPEGIIDRLGGWSGGAKKKTRERYTHLAVDHLRPYAAVIDRVLAGQPVVCTEPFTLLSHRAVNLQAV